MKKHDIVAFVVNFIEKVDNLHNDRMPHELQELTFMRKVQTETPGKLTHYCKETASDILSKTEDWDVDRVRRADQILHSQGAPSLSEMRFASNLKLHRILKLGKISRLTDYYYIKNLVSDNAGNIALEEVTQMDELLLEYEARCSTQLRRKNRTKT